MDQAAKVRENRLRRMAERQGCRLVKSRRRDPRALGFGGYMLIDARDNVALLGGSPHGQAAPSVPGQPPAFSASIEDVNDYLTVSREVTGQ